MEKLAYTVAETAKLISIGRNACYLLVHSGALKSIRVGVRIIIPAESIRAFLEAQMKDCGEVV